jgi:hypothetical protein
LYTEQFFQCRKIITGSNYGIRVFHIGLLYLILMEGCLKLSSQPTTLAPLCIILWNAEYSLCGEGCHLAGTHSQRNEHVGARTYIATTIRVARSIYRDFP